MECHDPGYHIISLVTLNRVEPVYHSGQSEGTGVRAQKWASGSFLHPGAFIYPRRLGLQVLLLLFCSECSSVLIPLLFKAVHFLSPVLVLE